MCWREVRHRKKVRYTRKPHAIVVTGPVGRQRSQCRSGGNDFSLWALMCSACDPGELVETSRWRHTCSRSLCVWSLCWVPAHAGFFYVVMYTEEGCTRAVSEWTHNTRPVSCRNNRNGHTTPPLKPPPQQPQRLWLNMFWRGLSSGSVYLLNLTCVFFVGSWRRKSSRERA